MNPLLIPQPDTVGSSTAPITARNGTQNGTQCSTQKPHRFAAQSALPSGDLEAAREARRLKLAAWAALDLRQQFTDEAWMRCHIKAAGLRAPNVTEPATVTRLRSCLKRADVRGMEIMACLGTTLTGYLKLNPLLPLWAALALVLEATTRFTAKAYDLSRAASPATHATV